MDILALFKVLLRAVDQLREMTLDMKRKSVSKGGKRLQPLEDNRNRSVSRKKCPVCGDLMQMSGQKADSNGIIKQRYLCMNCKRAGRSPYNFFEIENRSNTV
jgi:hypothetical protein